MWTGRKLRTAFASILFLFSAGLLALIVYQHERSEILSEAPRADLETKVVQAEGADGLSALSLFGGDAADLFATNRTAFRALMTIVRLNVPAREISAGPWREAVVQWARAGRLGPYVEHLKRLSPEQWEQVRKVPSCLPLLGRGAREAEAMLARHGQRAWRLFFVVDFADDTEGVERVARALAIHGDRMLKPVFGTNKFSSF